MACAVTLAILSCCRTFAQDPESVEDLTAFSFEELMEIEITSVRKKTEKLMDAAAAVHVLTADEIRRAGVDTIPEALRLVPGIQVAKIDANKWAISARGFNGRFSNRLLVLVDGRSVYTPLFSGVYWELRDVILEDIERIEVIRGPGGTLWGANAVNGVINIITKRSQDTQGSLAVVGTGTEDRFTGAARYGGRFSDTLSYRVFGKYFVRDGGVDRGGDDTSDDWSGVNGGFRLDWEATKRDELSFIADAHYVRSGVEYALPTLAAPDYVDNLKDNIDANSQSLVARWTRQLGDDSNLVVQAYYLREDRHEYEIEAIRDTVDFEGQHRFRLTEQQEILWGMNYRVNLQEYHTSGLIVSETTHFVDQLVSVFIQDDIHVVPDTLRATIGTKLDYNTYTKFEVQPSVRVLWSPHERHRIWTAVSRAVRTPARGERVARSGFQTIPGNPPFVPPTLIEIHGNRNVDAEDLLAFEVGYRTQPSEDFSLDIATFYNRYDDVVTLEPGAATTRPGPPFHAVQRLDFENRAEADTYGVEIAASWRVIDWWSVAGTFTLFKLDMHRDADSVDFFVREGREPKHQATFRSSMDLPGNVELDTSVFYTDHINDVSSYVRLDVRLGWRPYGDDRLEISIGGRNLTDSQHPEFFREFRESDTETERSYWASLVLRF